MTSTAQKETLEANQYVHATLVQSGEYEKSPHFRPENKQKVRALVEKFAEPVRAASAKAIDFGCGTGFMIALMHDMFSEVHGVDITRAMMDRVDLTPGNIILHESMAEKTQFPDQQFDFATAYSFMDHLYDAEAFLREVHRVLRSGGVFYSGLNPHRAFILAMEAAASFGIDHPSAIVDREIKGALHNGEYYAENFGLNGAMLEKAEPIKSDKKGFDAEEIHALSRRIGFTECRVEYEWFLGQGHVMHTQSFEAAQIVDQHLQSILPASASLYKYLTIVLTK